MTPESTELHEKQKEVATEFFWKQKCHLVHAKFLIRRIRNAHPNLLSHSKPSSKPYIAHQKDAVKVSQVLALNNTCIRGVIGFSLHLKEIKPSSLRYLEILKKGREQGSGDTFALFHCSDKYRLGSQSVA